MTAGQMTAGQMTASQMTASQMTASQMTASQMTIMITFIPVKSVYFIFLSKDRIEQHTLSIIFGNSFTRKFFQVQPFSKQKTNIFVIF